MTPSASQTNPGVGGFMGGTSSRLLGSSPAGAMTGFESPAALGLSLGQFAGIEGGVGMGISMSGISTLGLGGSSMGGRGDDEERRKRLEAVLGKLRTKNGRVSEEGIERLSRRCGLEALWEERRKDGTKVLSIAGQTMLIDVCEVLTDDSSGLKALIRIMADHIQVGRGRARKPHTTEFFVDCHFFCRTCWTDLANGSPTSSAYTRRELHFGQICQKP